MKPILSSRWFLLLLRLAVGGLFLYAGLLKLRNPFAFADSIASFEVLPRQVINLLALGLPPLEILLGLLLVIGWKIRTASLGITLLAMIFAVALAEAILRGLNIDCGCFSSGHLSHLQPWLGLGRDLLLVAVGVWLYLQTAQNHKASNWRA